MDFILRHKFTYLFGVLLGILNFFCFKVTITNDILFSYLAVLVITDCISSAVLTTFFEKMLRENKLFRSLFLDFKLMETLILTVVFQVVLLIIILFRSFIHNNGVFIASVWFAIFGFVIGLLVSCLVQIFKALYGLWQQRQNNKDLY